MSPRAPVNFLKSQLPIRDCSDKNKFPFKFRKMIQIFDEHNKGINYSILQPKLSGVKL